MKIRIPFLTRLLEIKEKQLVIEEIKIILLLGIYQAVETDDENLNEILKETEKLLNDIL